jgi:hypothetical protein
MQNKNSAKLTKMFKIFSTPANSQTRWAFGKFDEWQNDWIGLYD